MKNLKSIPKIIKYELHRRLIVRTARLPYKKRQNSNAVCVFVNKDYCKLLDNWMSFAKIPSDWDFVVVCFDEESRAFAETRNISTGFINSGKWIGFIWIARVLYLEKILRQYSRVIVSDIDAIWTGDPISFLGQNVEADFTFSQGTFFPQEVYQQTKTVVCCGWFVIKNSNSCKHTLKCVIKDMRQTFDDQVSFNRVFHHLGLNWNDRKMTSVLHDDVEIRVTREPQTCALVNGCAVELLPMQIINRLRGMNSEALVQHPVSPKDVKAKINLLKSLKLWN